VDLVRGNRGWVEVIVGPTFSGKSEELIRRLRRAEIARQLVQVFRCEGDGRQSSNQIVSHSGLHICSIGVSTAAAIFQKVQARTEVIGIDEAQFLDEEVVEVCARLASLGKRVVVAGLDTDCFGRPFACVQQLLSTAEEITKLLAICARCGNPAVHTQKMDEREGPAIISAPGVYEARCRRCFEPALGSVRENSVRPLPISGRIASAGGA